MPGRRRTYRPRHQEVWRREVAEVKIPGVQLLSKRKDRGDLKGTDRMKASDHHYHEQFMESFSSASYSKCDDYKALSSQEWKADKSMDDRTVQPVVTSWGETHKSQSSFFHDKTQHDGTAQSIVKEEELHDRTVQPVVHPQTETRPQQFIIGNDETESELSMGSRSFFNRVNDQVRK